jgi:hemolysin activation/secretion protein
MRMSSGRRNRRHRRFCGRNTALGSALILALLGGAAVAAPGAEIAGDTSSLVTGGTLSAPAIGGAPGGAFVLPPVAAPPKIPTGPLAQAPRFRLLRLRLVGNTVLDKQSIDRIVAPFLNKLVSVADLEAIRQQLTQLYIKRGYLNSGVIIPDQKTTNGVITMKAIEGRVTGVAITGTHRFNPEYFQSRLEDSLHTPFNVTNVETEQQLLLQNSLVRQLNIQLLPGLAPGDARLNANVVEATPYSLSAVIANDQSPTVGEVRGQLRGAVSNIVGYGDTLSAEYGRSDGLNDGALNYSIPLASDDTSLNLHYDINGVVIVDPALRTLNITSNYSSESIGLSRPIIRTPQYTLSLGINLDHREAQTFLLGLPFSFTEGADNGKTNVTALRFYQNFVERDADQAFAARSTLSQGLHTLGATVESVGPSGSFFDWQGQAQYLRRIYKDWEVLLRSDLQLADHPLFPIEQAALGGIDTVRGYREYLTFTDDAFVGSGELHIPVGQLRVPKLADAPDAGKVQLVPFYDYGRGWNVERPTPAPSDISGAGLGLRWLIGSGVTAETYYAKALRNVRVGTSLEDRGIYFRLTVGVF